MTNYDIEKRDRLEREILGLILSYKGLGPNGQHLKEWVRKTHGIDNSEYFYSKLHKAIFASILKCWEQGYDVDVTTVLIFRPDEYKDRSDFNEYSGFDLAVMNCYHTFLSVHQFDTKLFILKQYILMDYWNEKVEDIAFSEWEVRDVIVVGQNIVDGYKLLIDKFTNDYKRQNSPETMKERAKKAYEDAKLGITNWVPTGIPSYDRKHKGFRNGELIIIAGRPSMGKSAIMVACAWHASKYHNKKILLFSLEVDRMQIINHIIASESGIDYDKVKDLDLTESELEVILSWYDYFENHETFKVYDIKTHRTAQDIYDETELQKPHIVYVDYLQLVKMENVIKKQNSSREQDVAEISRTLKLMTVEFKIPVIAGAQLSRGVDSRPGHKPQLSDLRESGSIEQDADVVWFPFRQAYYDEQNMIESGIEIPFYKKGNYDIHQAKGRDQGTGHYLFNLDLITYIFTDGFIEETPVMNIVYE